MKMKIRQWLHANINVRDLDRSIPFYEMLGFEKATDQIFEPGAGVWPGLGLPSDRRFRAVFMAIPGDQPVPFIDMIQFLDPPTSGEAYPTLANVGICRLAFLVDDIHAAAAHLEINGVEFVGPVADYETARGVRPGGVEAQFVCFKDPDGTILEYVQSKGETQELLKPPKQADA